MARSIKGCSSGAVAAMSVMMMCLLLAMALTVQAAVVCENHGSGDPTLADSINKANWLIGGLSGYGPGSQCCQTNNGGNYCTTEIATCAEPCTGRYSYDLRICGPYNQCMPCADAGGLTWEIINQCQWNDNGIIRVSGYNNGYSPFTIVLRNSSN